MAADMNAALFSQADRAGTAERVVAVARTIAAGDPGNLGYNQVRQRFELSLFELIEADHANANRLLIEPGRLSRDLVDVAAGECRAVTADQIVIADRCQVGVLPGAPFIRSMKAAFDVPGVNHLGRIQEPARTRRTAI